MNRLFNTEYEQNPSNRSGASGGGTYIDMAFQKKYTFISYSEGMGEVQT
jgi:hypothetical protein